MQLFDSKRQGYWWFDTPDGEDIAKKTSFAMKLGYLGGIVPAVYDLTSRPQPSLSIHLFRASKIIVPFMGAGAMFALTSQFLCRGFPNLDRRMAYAVGGASVGTVVHAVAKNRYIGSITAFYGFIFSYFLRDFADQPLPLYGDPIPPFSDNDWELYRFSTRIDPGLNLPPPYARPARGGSSLEL